MSRAGTLATHPPPASMLRFLLAAVLFLPLAAAAQPADSLLALPRFRIPVTSDFAPLQTSAARATLYSVSGTGVPVLAGTAILLAAPPTRPEGGLSPSGIVGATLVMVGLVAGPPLGNLSLGAGRSVHDGTSIALLGVVVGSSTMGVGVGTLLLTTVTGSDGPLPTVGAALVIVGGSVCAGGFIAAGVYHFATIPRNARWAQRARANGNRVPQVRVSVAPGYDPRFDAPMATLRVTL